VIFSEAVDPVTGTNAANYGLNNGASVTGARFGGSQDTVLLRASGLVAGTTYTLTVNNVRDLASTPNTIAASSTIAVEQSLHTWMRLDESGGASTSDASGNNRNGTLTSGAAAGFAGKVLRAVKFDGVDDHVRLAENGYDDFTSGMTMAFWAKPATIALWARFVELGNAAASDNISASSSATGSG